MGGPEAVAETRWYAAGPNGAGGGPREPPFSCGAAVAAAAARPAKLRIMARPLDLRFAAELEAALSAASGVVHGPAVSILELL